MPVNSAVVNGHLLVPGPRGPRHDEKDAFEEAIRSGLGRLRRASRFHRIVECIPHVGRRDPLRHEHLPPPARPGVVDVRRQSGRDRATEATPAVRSIEPIATVSHPVDGRARNGPAAVPLRTYKSRRIRHLWLDRLDGRRALRYKIGSAKRLTTSIPQHFPGAVGAMELLSDIWDKTTDAFTALTEGVSEGLVRLFGSSNERRIRHMRATVDRINELEPAMQALSADELRAKTVELRERRQRGRVARRPLARGVCRRARVGPPLSQHASLRRAVDGRHGLARRKHRRDGDRAKARRWSPPWPPI